MRADATSVRIFPEWFLFQLPPVGPDHQQPPAQHAQSQLRQVEQELAERRVAPLRPGRVGGLDDDIGVIQAQSQQDQRGHAPQHRQAGDAMAQHGRDRIGQHAGEHIREQIGHQVGKVGVRQHDWYGADRHCEHDGDDGVRVLGPGVEAADHWD